MNVCVCVCVWTCGIIKKTRKGGKKRKKKQEEVLKISKEATEKHTKMCTEEEKTER